MVVEGEKLQLTRLQYVLDDSARSNLTNLNRWFKTIVHQQAVKAVIGEVSFVTNALQFDSKFHLVDFL